MTHEKGRDCARTEEVLENYRRRALAAEAELVRCRHGHIIDEPRECPDNQH